MDLSAWALWVVSVTLTLTVYLRVDPHDWGMVGLTIFLFGASVLTTRTMLRLYELEYGGDSSLYAWRGLVIVGGPVALAGFLAGWRRDPPPRGQVVRRLVVLAVILGIPAFVYLLT